MTKTKGTCRDENRTKEICMCYIRTFVHNQSRRIDDIVCRGSRVSELCCLPIRTQDIVKSRPQTVHRKAIHEVLGGRTPTRWGIRLRRRPGRRRSVVHLLLSHSSPKESYSTVGSEFTP